MAVSFCTRGLCLVGSILGAGACINAPLSSDSWTKSHALRNGDPLASVAGLSDAQRASVGVLWRAGRERWCTAAQLDPRHVVSAAHCFPSSSYELAQAIFGMSFVSGGTSEGTFLPVLDVSLHPELDIAVASLGADAPGDPIPLRLEPLDEAVLQSEVIVIGGGIGTTPVDGLAVGHFTIESFDDAVLHLRAIDDDGLCSGDSGSPVVAFGDAGPRIIGIHARGFSDCTGLSTEVRADVAAPFLRAASAREAPDAAPCVDGTDADSCDDAVTRRCIEGSWRTLDCALADFRCALIDRAALCEPVPCGEVAPVGRCDDGVARVCRGGTLVEQDCRATDQGCAFDRDEARYGCVDCTACDGVCIDLSNDRDHCSACGRGCAGACVDGACDIPDGAEPLPTEPGRPSDNERPLASSSATSSCAAAGAPDLGGLALLAAGVRGRRRRSCRR